MGEELGISGARGANVTAGDNASDPRRDLAYAWDRARTHSPFLLGAASRQPDILAAALEKGPDAALAIIDARSTGALESGLRVERDRLLLALGLGDLAGVLPFERVVGALSDFADQAVDRALAGAFEERFSDPAATGLAVLALGKHGSRELNYSSDIDLIVLYDPQSLPCRARDGPAESALRLTRRLIELLSRRTGEGHVFRVDLRLRPAAEVTPLALPVDAAISHYESHALPWERAAFIRARAAAGDRALGERFLQEIAPFRWRRALDFAALGEVATLARRIRDHFADRQAFGPGYDLKRGRGAIREIEFIAQAEQLVLGGRDPSLRAPATLDALAALARAGRFDPDEAAALADDYRLLRTIEHRLQMVDDQQTHRLPAGAALDGVARLHGLADGAALLALLRPTVTRVRARFDRLAPAGERSALPADAGALAGALARLGFPDGEDAARTVTRWRSGASRALRTAASHDALEAVLPSLLPEIAGSGDAGAALARFDRLFERLAGGVDLLSLLLARPAVAETLATLFAHSPALADSLARRPGLIDALLDRGVPGVPDRDALAAAFSASPGLGYEAELERVARQVDERRFALGAALVMGEADPLAVATGYAHLAEAAVGALVRATVSLFEAAHGVVPGGGLGIVGLGRLGGEALTHASDLDLVFVWTGPVDASSDGPKPLRATDYHNRLARRLVAAIGTPTAAGPLYEVDTRLRPQGGDGMLAVSLEGFERYQAEEAWTWERMALTRARAVGGSADTRAALDAAIARALSPPDPGPVLADALAMRRELARNKPAAGPLDVKLQDGGLVDLEFGVQVLQLTTGVGRTPRLGEAVTALIGAGRADPALAGAHDLLIRMLVILRLIAPDGQAPPPAGQALVARACAMEDWAELECAHDGAREIVRAFTRSVVGEHLC